MKCSFIIEICIDEWGKEEEEEEEPLREVESNCTGWRMAIARLSITQQSETTQTKEEKIKIEREPGYERFR